ncbi:MAG: glutamine-hydrolyzing carbamoyl-phosphate synthase small subunit, partial [Oscillibacter sp.]|nr:glutamine-hydrolyzing carbamoyl-phosphate synthase small subunit [Oscillibacter sp.]
GQIVLQTYPLIGNVGMIPEDFEGVCAMGGYVVREWCDTPSNFRAGETVDSFLKARGIPGLCGVDTRQITRILREQGVMNAMICDEVPADLSRLREYKISGQVEKLTCGEVTVHPAEGAVKYRVALIDYGAKRNIVRELQSRGCEVTVYPATVTAEAVLEGKPDGVVLSNGPGDPAENTFQIAQIKGLLGRVPLFGICLGHQMTALAAGGETRKLKYGHRGANQPVRELRPIFRSGEAGFRQTDRGVLRTYITSQNHGYTVDAATVPACRVSFVNANDNTCEGLDYPSWNAFTVQFHPEACGGPRDTGFLFDRFAYLMKGGAL